MTFSKTGCQQLCNTAKITTETKKMIAVMTKVVKAFLQHVSLLLAGMMNLERTERKEAPVTVESGDVCCLRQSCTPAGVQLLPGGAGANGEQV